MVFVSTYLRFEGVMTIQTRIKNRTAKILIVEPSAPARGMMADVLKGCGFSSLETMDSLKSALGFMEVEEVDWVISPIFMNDVVNLYHLLDIFSRHDKFRDTIVSGLPGDEDGVYVPLAFELGLLSVHKKHYSKDFLKAEFIPLLDRLSAHDELLKISSDYLLKDLREKSMFRSYLDLRSELYRLHPEVLQALLSLAEAQFLAGETEQAKHSLGQAIALGCPGAEALGKAHLPPGEVALPNIGIKSCLLVDPDETVHKAVGDILSRLGHATLVSKLDGDEAMEWIKSNSPPDLILQEWKLPKVSGAGLLQRVRQHKFTSIPIIVMSSLTTKQDIPLLNEMGVANIIPKPVEEANFIKTLIMTMTQDQSPTAQRMVEFKIHRLLMEGKVVEAADLRQHLEFDGNASDGTIKYVGALFSFYEKKFDLAKAQTMEAIHAHADQPTAFHLLGRILAKLGDSNGAFKCFKKAHSLSPRNIERLCELASVQVDLGDFAGASTTLEEAKTIDKASDVIKEHEGKMLIHKGDSEKAKEILNDLDSLTSLAADLNNAAVALIHSDQMDEGIELYKRTLRAIPAKQEEIHFKVLYNLALAYVKSLKLNDALELLEAVKPTSTFPVTKKMNSLRDKVRKAIHEDVPIDLHHHEASKQDLNLEIVAKIPGTVSVDDVLAGHGETNRNLKRRHCCAGVFKVNSSEQGAFQEYRRNPPKFQLRSAIGRDEAMGVEKG
jgi:CheY-like chemotaxis protein